MTAPKVTDWFPASVKPVRRGVYERIPTIWTGRAYRFAVWDGRKWLCSNRTAIGANFSAANGISQEQNTPWRGLTKRAR